MEKGKGILIVELGEFGGKPFFEAVGWSKLHKNPQNPNLLLGCHMEDQISFTSSQSHLLNSPTLSAKLEFLFTWKSSVSIRAWIQSLSSWNIPSCYWKDGNYDMGNVSSSKFFLEILRKPPNPQVCSFHLVNGIYDIPNKYPLYKVYMGFDWWLSRAPHLKGFFPPFSLWVKSAHLLRPHSGKLLIQKLLKSSAPLCGCHWEQLNAVSG